MYMYEEKGHAYIEMWIRWAKRNIVMGRDGRGSKYDDLMTTNMLTQCRGESVHG